nr:MAG TPA_asm: hypothetical protein [Caudoviricetes sp.]
MVTERYNKKIINFRIPLCHNKMRAVLPKHLNFYEEVMFECVA